MHRLFVALRPPPAVRTLLTGLRTEVPGARWQDDEQLHLTLRFAGELDPRQADDFAAALAAVHAPAPSVRLAGVGRFDAGRGGAALWAGIAPRDPLAALHRKIDRAALAAGLEPDRRAFLPHVTVARLSRGAAGGIEVERWLARHAGLASEAFTLAHLVLYESRLGRDGAAYEAVARWPLAAEGTG